MIKLYELVPELNKEESRNVSIFLNRTNAHRGRKDLALFEYVRKNKSNIDETILLEKLYGDKAEKNTFYRLKNRLLNDINKSLLFLHFNKNDYNTVLNLVSLSKLFFGKGNYLVSYKYLIQAEKKAIKNEFFDLLDLVYSDLIKLSHESADYNPIQYIEKRKQNHVKLHALQEIDDLLAALMYRIKVSQNYGSDNVQFTALFQKTIDEFLQNSEIQKSAKLQFKIYHSISRILLQRRDYFSLEEYLKLTFKDFTKRRLFNKQNHDTKLQMLTYLVNALFKNNKTEESLKHSKLLYEAMQEYDNSLFNKYLFYYYNGLVINYQVTDKLKAIEVLLEAKTKPEIQQLSFFTVFVYLNLAVLYFDTGNFKSAKTNLAKLKMSDSYGKMDEAFRVKVSIVDLITIYELGDIDLFDYQLNNLNKEYKTLLLDKAYKRELDFITILSKMDDVDKKKLKPLVNQFINNRQSIVSTESDIIDYQEWLKNKMQ